MTKKKKKKEEILIFLLPSILIWKSQDINTVKNIQILECSQSNMFGIPLTSSFINVIPRLILRFREPIAGSGARFSLYLCQQDVQHKRKATKVPVGAEDSLTTLHVCGGRGWRLDSSQLPSIHAAVCSLPTPSGTVESLGRTKVIKALCKDRNRLIDEGKGKKKMCKSNYLAPTTDKTMLSHSPSNGHPGSPKPRCSFQYPSFSCWARCYVVYPLNHFRSVVLAVSLQMFFPILSLFIGKAEWKK